MTAMTAMTANDRDDRDCAERTEGHVTNRPRELARSDCIFRMGKCARNHGRGGRRRSAGGPHAGYSARNVIAGSTCAARHAGAQHAITDTPPSSAITPR
jgi:hypothetical protein